MVNRIKQKCIEKKTTMGALEKELGFANGTIRRWDERKPSVDRAIALANRLEVSVEWLVTGKERKDLSPEEQILVDTFRRCNSTGKLLIQEHADTIRKTLPAEQENQDAGVSTSAIG